MTFSVVSDSIAEYHVGTPRDSSCGIPFAYTNIFSLLIIDQIDWHTTNFEIETCTGVKQISQALVCSVCKDYGPIFASLDGRSGYVRIIVQFLHH